MSIISEEFQCQICLEFPADPVATVCGHVYCWPCIYRWLESGPKPCPVCSSVLKVDCNILPLDAAGSSDGDGSTIVPPRPSSPLFFVHDIDFDGLELPGKTPEWKAVCLAVREGIMNHIRARDEAYDKLARLQALITRLQQKNTLLARKYIRMHHRIEGLRLRTPLGSLVKEEFDSQAQQQIERQDQQ